MLKTAFVWMLNCTLCASVVLLYIMLFRLVVRRSSRRWCYLLWIPAAFRLLCSRTPFFLRWRWSLLPRADFFHTEAGSAGTLLYGAMNYTAHGDALTGSVDRVVLPVPDRPKKMAVFSPFMSVLAEQCMAAMPFRGR